MQKPYGILFIGVTAASFASILIRSSNAQSLVIATYRLGLASLFMALLALKTDRFKSFSKLNGNELGLIVLSGIFLGIHFATWVTSLFYTSVAVSVIVVNSAPIYVVILSYLFLDEKLSSKGKIGMLSLLLGGLFIVLNELNLKLSLYGVFLAFSGSITLACYFVIGRKVRRKVDTFSYVSVVYFVSFLLLFASSLFFGQRICCYPLRDNAIFVLLALVPSCLGHTSYNYCLKYFTASQVSASILGEPIGATLLAIIFLSEFPTFLVLVGGFLVIAGLLMVMEII